MAQEIKIICPNCGKECRNYDLGRGAGFFSFTDKNPPSSKQDDNCFCAGWKQGQKDLDDSADVEFQHQHS